MSERTGSEKVEDRELCQGFSGECVGEAIDSFVASLETTFKSPGWPLVVRVDQETLAKLDLLVSGGVCESRVDAAAYLMQRGVESSESMLGRIAAVNDRIDDIKQDLSDWVETSKA
jgi:hypothetical protein